MATINEYREFLKDLSELNKFLKIGMREKVSEIKKELNSRLIKEKKAVEFDPTTQKYTIVNRLWTDDEY